MRTGTILGSLLLLLMFIIAVVLALFLKDVYHTHVESLLQFAKYGIQNSYHGENEITNPTFEEDLVTITLLASTESFTTVENAEQSEITKSPLSNTQSSKNINLQIHNDDDPEKGPSSHVKYLQEEDNPNGKTMNEKSVTPVITIEQNQPQMKTKENQGGTKYVKEIQPTQLIPNSDHERTTPMVDITEPITESDQAIIASIQRHQSSYLGTHDTSEGKLPDRVKVSNEALTTKEDNSIDDDFQTADYSNCSNFENVKPKGGGIYPDQWQLIGNVSSYIYSAYYDPRRNKVFIRSFGMMLSTMLLDPVSKQLYCQLWHVHAGFEAVVPGITRVPTNKTKYESFILDCIFPMNTSLTTDHFLSVSVLPCSVPRNALTIHNIESIPEKPEYKYMVCVSNSLSGNFSNYGRLVEWMELNKILGVQKTIIYKTSVSPVVEEVLRYYTYKGMIEVIDWHPPNDNTRRLAPITMGNDCLYRNMWRTQYLGMMDVDETIAPRKSYVLNWNHMIRKAECETRSYIAALNTFFRTDWGDDHFYRHEENIAKKLQLITILKTKREHGFSQFNFRSKPIMRPDKVALVKMHRIFLLDPSGDKPCIIHPRIGALYHYKALPASKKLGSPNEPSWIADRSLHVYGALLFSRVHEVYTELNNLDKLEVS